jgi:hypothetical protein
MPGPCQKNKAAKAEYDRPTASLCWVRMDNIRCENDSAAPAGHNETRVLSLMSALQVNSGRECVVRQAFGYSRFCQLLAPEIFSGPAFTIKAARSIRHQIIVAAQNALDVECGASCGVGIGNARGQHT